MWNYNKIYTLKITIALNFLLLSSFAWGQVESYSKTLNKELTKIISQLENHNFREAINEGEILLKRYPKNPDICLMLGLSHINLAAAPDSAIYYLQLGIDALDANEITTITGINLQLSMGKAYQINLKPEKSIEIYNKLLKILPPNNDDLVLEIKKEIDVSENSFILLQNPVAIKITNLGPLVNSKYDDHSPLVNLAGKKMYFTSRRSQPGLTLLSDGQYPEKICVSTLSNNGWSQAEMLKTFFKKNDHESAVSISPDGKSMFLFKNDFDGKNLYLSEFRDNIWGDPSRMPDPINSLSDETHCSLSADESTLFFTSDRPGGFGGLDIYLSKKKLDGTWGTPKNLGPQINTSYDEETPFIYLDGKTLYFSSEGHNSMGMFDVFYSVMNPDSSWIEPINLGYPINSPGDDFFFVPTLNRNQAYYASSQFEDNIGGTDIYLVEFEKEFEGKLAIIEGKVENKEGGKVLRILVSRVYDQQLVGDYRPDPITGEYVLFLETGQRYQIKEVRKVTEEVVVGEIEVPLELGFNVTNEMIDLKKINIEPPLSPEQRIKLVQSMEMPDKATRYNDDYTIQLLALKQQPVKDLSFFTGLDSKRIKIYKCIDGYTRYSYDIVRGFDKALLLREEVLKTGKYKDAFIRPTKTLDILKP